MKTPHSLSILLLAILCSACEPVVAPVAERPVQANSAIANAQAPHIAAGGTFTQTEVTSLDVRTAGPNTILDQTSRGVITGTLDGDFEDRLKVTIHPNGRFNAHFTITCECTVAGREGILESVAGDTGELVTPDLATFAGRAVINGGTGGLSGLRGVLGIEGEVDVPTGLSTYTYSGTIHFAP